MDAPKLELLRQGDSRLGLIFIPGYLTQDSGIGPRWVEAAIARGYHGRIYQLRWDSSRTAALRHAIPHLLAAPLEPASIAVTGAVKLRLHWSKLKRRAKRVGIGHLPRMVESLPATEITIVAHSLGARVAYYGLSAALLPETVSRLVMCGGAIRRDSSKDWPSLAARLSRGLHNIRNEKDWVLKTVFKVAERNQNPVGLRPIKACHPAILDINATGLLPAKIGDGLSSHSSYYEVFADSIDQRYDLSAARPPDRQMTNEASEERKHCRVCGKRIKGGLKFQRTRRFCCKVCRHRTHVSCAASVSDERCAACG